MRRIDLLQRGSPYAIGRIDYDNHWRSALAILATHRVLTVTEQSEFVLITPTQYVGFARTLAGELRIAPRFPDLFKALRSAYPSDARAARGQGYDVIQPAQQSDRVTRVLTSAEQVLSNGLPFRYSRKQSFGSPRGRIDLGATIRQFASRGVHHRAVSHRSVRQHDTELLSLARTAFDFMRSESLLGVSEIRQATAMESAFGLQDVAPVPLTAVHDISVSVIVNTDREDVIELAQAIRHLIDAELTDDDVTGAYGDVFFHFTDLDSLWERALQTALQGLGIEARLHPLRGASTPYLADGGPNIDPDVVGWSEGRPVVVADAKDSAATAPSASDVYQISAYAQQLGAPVAVLVYLSAGDAWRRRFGDDNLTIWSLGVPAREGLSLDSIRHLCQPVIDQAMSLAQADGGQLAL